MVNGSSILKKAKQRAAGQGLNTDSRLFKKATQRMGSNLSDLSKELPEYEMIVEQVEQQQEKLTQINKDIATDIESINASSAEFKNNYTDIYNNLTYLQDDYNFLSKSEQFSYDNLIHQAYEISKIDTKGPKYFIDFINKETKAQFDDMISYQSKKEAATIQNGVNNTDLMTNIISYQNYVLELQKEWMNNANQQAIFQVQLLSELQDASNTEKRKTKNNFKSLINYDNFNYWLRIILYVLIIFIILVLIYKKISEYEMKNIFSFLKKNNLSVTPSTT